MHRDELLCLRSLPCACCPCEQFIVVGLQDRFWFNRLQEELGIDSALSDQAGVGLGFHELLLALCKLRFGSKALPYGKTDCVVLDSASQLAQSHCRPLQMRRWPLNESWPRRGRS